VEMLEPPLIGRLLGRQDTYVPVYFVDR